MSVAYRVLALTTLLAASACSSEKGKDSGRTAEPARAVSVVTVASRPMGSTLQASGLLIPKEEAAISSELSGYRVADVLVDEGDLVRVGQPLARLDPALLYAKIAQGRAQVAQAEAQAAQSRSEAARVKGLDGSGLLSDEQIATRRFTAASNEAALDVSRAQLRDLLTQQARLTIRSPVSGVVLQRNAKPGAVAAAGGDPMFRIARDRLIELDTEVPEDVLFTLRPGLTTRVMLPSGQTVTGQVRFVSPRVDSDTKLGHARISLPVDRQLRAGGFARAEFSRPARIVPAVPEGAVQFEASGASVVVVDARNRAHRVTVQTGSRADGWVELVKGPALGSTVTLGGGAFVLDGDVVRPVRQAGAAAR